MTLTAILGLATLLLVNACATAPKETASSGSGPSPAAAPSATSTTPPASSGDADATAESSAPSAEPATPAAPTALSQGFACTRGEDARLIYIEGVAPAGCKLWYSRRGDKSVMAQSRNGTKYCEKTRDNIKGNLEESGYLCRPYRKRTPNAVSRN